MQARGPASLYISLLPCYTLSQPEIVWHLSLYHILTRKNMLNSSSDIAGFARDVLGRPLYPYQAEIAGAILASIRGGHGRIFTVMMARQSGKNQLSAVIEAYLLATEAEGTIIKAAPTFNPQIANSRERLRMLLNSCELQERVWSNRSMVGLAPSADLAQLRRRLGPRVTFYSASPHSNVVGATADL